MTTAHAPHSHTSIFGLHLRAPNDQNGNPRRLYVVIADDECSWVYDEGYLGVHAVPAEHRERIAGRWTQINITRAEYSRVGRGI